MRAAQYAAAGDAGEDAAGAPDDERMFSLGDLPGDALPAAAKGRKKGRDALAGVAEAAAPDDDVLDALEAGSSDDYDSDASSDDDSDDPLAYERRLEADLERSYSEYLERRGERCALNCF